MSDPIPVLVRWKISDSDLDFSVHQRWRPHGSAGPRRSPPRPEWAARVRRPATFRSPMRLIGGLGSPPG
eukprot:9494354-Pyramimonas_sp.AAC.1